MNEEIDGGLGKDKSEKTLRKRLELIMTDTQTPEDQAADLDNVERDANH